MPIKTPYVTLILKRNNDERCYHQVECNVYDMSAYVDELRCLMSSDLYDYMIVEPNINIDVL